MVNLFEGEVKGGGCRVAIVVSRFNTFITEKLLSSALDCLKQNGVPDENIDVAWVPGAFEIPQAARKFCERNRYEAVICLGAVIRGATPHFDFVAGECARGVSNLAMEFATPVLFGVLTTDSVEQAEERAGGKSGSNSGNKGWETALAALEMINLYQKLA